VVDLVNEFFTGGTVVKKVFAGFKPSLAEGVTLMALILRYTNQKFFFT